MSVEKRTSSSETRLCPTHIGRCVAGYVPRNTVCDVRSRQKPRQAWPVEEYDEQMSCTTSRLEMLSEAEPKSERSSGPDGGEMLNLIPADLETPYCQLSCLFTCQGSKPM